MARSCWNWQVTWDVHRCKKWRLDQLTTSHHRNVVSQSGVRRRASGIIEVLADESEGVEYEWTNSASTENVASGLPQGSYEVMVTNVAGCQDSATFT